MTFPLGQRTGAMCPPLNPSQIQSWNPADQPGVLWDGFRGENQGPRRMKVADWWRDDEHVR